MTNTFRFEMILFPILCQSPVPSTYARIFSLVIRLLTLTFTRDLLHYVSIVTRQKMILSSLVFLSECGNKGRLIQVSGWILFMASSSIRIVCQSRCFDQFANFLRILPTRPGSWSTGSRYLSMSIRTSFKSSDNLLKVAITDNILFSALN